MSIRNLGGRLIKNSKVRYFIGAVCLLVAGIVLTFNWNYWLGLALVMVGILYLFFLFRFELPRWRKK